MHFADHVVLGAIGIDINGKKHVLLIERGLAADRMLLFVIDAPRLAA